MLPVSGTDRGITFNQVNLEQAREQWEFWGEGSHADRAGLLSAQGELFEEGRGRLCAHPLLLGAPFLVCRESLLEMGIVFQLGQRKAGLQLRQALWIRGKAEWNATYKLKPASHLCFLGEGRVFPPLRTTLCPLPNTNLHIHREPWNTCPGVAWEGHSAWRWG